MNNNIKDKLTITLFIIIIILILVILWLLFGNKNANKLQVPTGNVDIFEIQCDINCNCGEDEPVFKEDYDINNFQINDKEIAWESNNELNIFSNPMYEMKKIIAPESTNIYQFIIKNNTIYNVKYNINFVEKNEYNINMKYRLKNGNEYVAGDDNTWVTYEKLNLNNTILNKSESKTYYLEWKWFESSNDTVIGKTQNVKYSLSIAIEAVGINE